MEDQQVDKVVAGVRPDARPCARLLTRTTTRPRPQLKSKYGGLPTQKGMLERRLKGGDKKYFDSADWAQDKASPPAERRPAEAVRSGEATVPPPLGKLREAAP